MPKSETVLPLIRMLCLLAEHKSISIEPQILQNSAHSTDAIFTELAQMGFETRTLLTPLDKILQQSLPCVLILNAPSPSEPNRAALLLSKKGSEYQIILSDNAPTVSTITEEELSEIYTSYAIFSAQEQNIPEVNTPDVDFFAQKRGHWFWNVFLHFMPIYKRSLIASFIINLLALAGPLFMMNVYDRVIPNNATDTLLMMSIGVFLAFFADFVLKSLRAYFVDLAGQNADVILSDKVFRKILQTKFSLLPKSTGALNNKLRELEFVRDFLGSTTLVALFDLPFVIIFIAIIGMLGGSLVFIPLLALPIMFIISYFFQAPIKSSMDKQLKSSDVKNSVLIDSILGMETVKTNLLHSHVAERFLQSSRHNAKANSHAKRINALAANSSGLVASLSNVAIIIAGAYLISAQAMSMGGLIACVILFGRIIASFMQMTSILLNLQKTKSTMRNLDMLMALETENTEQSSTTIGNATATANSLKIENLSFSYPENSELVFNNISFDIKAGEKVAILGGSGSGKSTLFKLIMGLYEPKQGRIFLDDIDINHLHTYLLRSHIGYLAQDPFLFSGTLMENISLGMKGISPHHIKQAAEIAGVLDFSKNLSKGLLTDIGERGHKLSGGQRQAVALARTILRKPQILLLDEPTAALDSQSELRFIERAQYAFKDCTVLISSHRQALLHLTSRAIILNNGKAIMSSSPTVKRKIDVEVASSPPKN